jgi:quinoprotein glucose dehydrogenase
MGAQAAATNWPGGSFDPELHTVFVASQTSVATAGLVPPPPGISDFKYFQGTVLSGARLTGGSGSGAGANASVGGDGRSTIAAPTGRDAAPAGGRGATAAAAAGGTGRGGRGGGAEAGVGGEGGGGGGNLTVQGLPLIRPPYSRITAINLDTGDFNWQVPFGATPDNIKNNPALKQLDLPPLGRPGNNSGNVVTKTLLIIGEHNVGPTPSGQRGAMLRAYDKKTGKEVGAVYMPAPQSGSPMTYMLNGKQYVVVAISGGTYSGELLAYKLPN